jgi:hypothetical protein
MPDPRDEEDGEDHNYAEVFDIMWHPLSNLPCCYA